MKALREDIPMLLVVFFFSVVFFAVESIEENVPAYAYLNETVTVIIDAGHGGEDGGAVGANNVLEKDINLNIAMHLSDMLTVSGMEVILTRSSDVSLYDEGNNTLRDKKISDMDNRLDIIKENPNALFISIHQNTFPEEYCKGAQVFYNDNNAMSEILANEVQNSLIAMLDPTNTREEKSSGAEYFLLEYSQNPGIIVECGFLSNNEEGAKLATSEYQKQVAFAIFAGISAYNGI